MKKSNLILIVALLFPVIVLLALTFHKKHIIESGAEVILPITGYDPRDLLSGHYLIYTVEYGIKSICPNGGYSQKAYVCLDDKSFSYTWPRSCKLAIQGVCNYNRFVAGIEKFFIPENVAVELDKKIREKKASILISVTPYGQAQVKDLLLDGQKWGQVSN